MLSACPRIRCMRDLTRGGLSSALHELAAASHVGVELREQDIPLEAQVRAACEMLGLDAIYVANEGKLVAVVPPEDTATLLRVMREHPLGRDAAVIGEVRSGNSRMAKMAGMVVMRSAVGGERVVTRISGEQLPRIC